MFLMKKLQQIGTFRFFFVFILIKYLVKLMICKKCCFFIKFSKFSYRVLFDYEGQTNVLKLSSKGDGGLLELTDELNSGKIMYAIVSVQDPKTSLTKIILINWQVSMVNNNKS